MESAYGSGWHIPIGWMAWLATTDVRLWIYDQRALYGVMRFLHLTGSAAFVGGIAMLAVRRAAVTAPPPGVPGSFRAVRTWLNAAFVLVLLTGAWLFLRDPIGMGLHTMFLPKLVLVCLGFGLTRLLQRPRFARGRAAYLSIGLWLAVIGASTWNHVERPANINAALRASATGR